MRMIGIVSCLALALAGCSTEAERNANVYGNAAADSMSGQDSSVLMMQSLGFSDEQIREACAVRATVYDLHSRNLEEIGRADYLDLLSNEEYADQVCATVQAPN